MVLSVCLPECSLRNMSKYAAYVLKRWKDLKGMDGLVICILMWNF
jgi:hypothetical protein